MRRFLFDYSITSASGTQTFYVDAETLEEATEKLKTGGEIYAYNCEVTDLGTPEYSGFTDTDDFGEFPKVDPVTAERERIITLLESIGFTQVRETIS